jgi:hypothetical protein
VAIIPHEKRRPRNGEFMKKATGSIKNMTREVIRNYKLTRSDKEDLRRLALLPDNRIDTTDIPDLGARKGWSRVRADRPATRQISIRLRYRRGAATRGGQGPALSDLHQIIAS